MKILAVILLSLFLLFCMVGCSNDSTSPPPTNNYDTVQQQNQQDDDTTAQDIANFNMMMSVVNN